jgi:hypothetical protein
MIIAEKSGKKLQWLSDDDSYNEIIDIITEVKMLTGALVYSGKEFEIQAEMLQLFIVSGFGMLSKSEIVYAFYLNLQGQFDEVYVHYNKELNAEFVGNVLRGYLKYKKIFLRQKRDSIITLLEPPKMEKYEIDYDFWKELVQQDLDYLKNINKDSTLWNVRKYYTLRKFGLMPFKGKSTFFYFIKKAIGNKYFLLNLPQNTNYRNYEFTSVMQLRSIFKTSQDYHICIEDARKLSYWYVLQTCADFGINNIWQDVKPIFTK